MKFSQVLIAMAIGAVLFTGLYMAENARRSNFQILENPFEKTTTLPEIIAIDETDTSQKIFAPDRSLWQFYPGSQSEFNEKTRIINEGLVFVSFNFINEGDIKRIRNAQITNFDPTNFQPDIAQFTVGSLGISAPGASLFINRDSANGNTKIYTYHHAIDIWFPGASEAFTLPALSQVSINDKTVKILAKLYYTKLKKDLRLQPFSIETGTMIGDALEAKAEKLEAIKHFAENLPRTWYSFDPNSLMGKATNLIKYLQRDYALGISQKVRQKYLFDSFITPFLSAHHGYLNNDPQANEKLTGFIETINSGAWQRFLLKYPRFAEKWSFLGQNQKVWLHHAFQDDPEYIFAPVWFTQGEARSVEELEDAFFEVEEMMGNQFTAKAKSGLSNLQSNLGNIAINSQDASRITRLRRLLNEMLSREIILQTEEVFALLQNLIEVETDLYTKGRSNHEEVVLENAQDILRFLKAFIGNRTAGKINQTLVNSYAFLEIDQIEEQLGRSIFNQAEKETIRLVQFVRAEDLTEGELSQIEANKSLQDLINERFAELEAGRVEEAEVVYAADKIDTQEELIELLAEARVFTEGIRVERKGDTTNPSFTFSGAYFDKYPLNGVFRIDNQEFNFIKLQSLQEKFVTPRYLASILRRLEKDVAAAVAVDITPTGPSNNTPLAILQRKLVRDTFEQEGLKVDREKVSITSADYNEFEIEKAVMGKEYRIDFTYFQKEEYVTNLVVDYVRNRFEFGDQIIPRKGLKQFITEDIEARFKKD